MLVAARSSQDFAFCFRAISSALTKQVSALGTSGFALKRAIAPATRLISASYQFSFVLFTAVIASPILAVASSSCPSSAFAHARWDKNSGIHIVVPVDRIRSTPAAIVWAASGALPVSVIKQPRCIIPHPVQNDDPS